MAICTECGRKFHFASDPETEEYKCVICRDKERQSKSTEELANELIQKLDTTIETMFHIDITPRCIIMSNYNYNLLKRDFKNRKKEFVLYNNIYVYRSLDIKSKDGFDIL